MTVAYVPTYVLPQVRGGEAVSCTVASTRESCRRLYRRSVETVSQSGSEGLTDFGCLDNSVPMADGPSLDKEALPRRMGGRSPKCNGNGYHGDGRDNIIHPRTCSSAGTGCAQAESRSLHKMLASRDRKIVPITRAHARVRCEACSSLPLEVTDGGRGITNHTSEASVVLNRTYAGPAIEREKVPNHGREHPQSQATVNKGDHEANTASTLIAQFLARLPLSKIKIVIGKRS